MANLFIPPPGAMQFELIPNGVSQSRSVALDWKEKECDVIWIDPTPLAGQCRQHPHYRVMLESLPPRMRALAEMKSIEYGGQPIRVCACMGRIIE